MRTFASRGRRGRGLVVLVAVAAIGGWAASSRAGGRESSTRSYEPIARATSRRRRAAPAPPSFIWMVPLTATQPSAAEDNRHPGTRAWRLPGPAADVGGLARGSIAGYPSAQAVLPGQRLSIYVSAPGARRVRIAVFRMGWYGGMGGREVLRTAPLAVRAQPPCGHRSATGLTECHWHATLSFVVPAGLASGVYIAKLSSDRGAVSDCLFVVRALRPTRLLAQLPTSTYEAYNAWGGDSLYPDATGRRVGVTGTTQGVEVSYDRPYDSVTGAGEFFSRDVALVRFLERFGYPVSYTDSESVDADPGQLAGHRVLLDFGHSEYWSQVQYDAWMRARDDGTNLVFLSSDTLAWKVRYAAATAASSQAGQPAHVIVAYKEHSASDPDRADPSGAFPSRGAPLTGSAYVGCITPRVDRPGPPTYLYYDWAPSPELRPAWLFAHSGITASTRIPGIVGYELDQVTLAGPVGTELVGGGSVVCSSSGADEPGEPVPGPNDHYADTTVYTARSGAIVIATGTLGWELGLEPVPSASPDAPRAPDPRVVAMTRNLLARVLAQPDRHRTDDHHHSRPSSPPRLPA